MDNIAIEKRAVNYVEDTVLLCEHLTPYINDNDKEPSWDGSIIIYKTSKKTKDELVGRVPVQVKGKLVKPNKITCEQISFSIKTSDLRNYLNEGGTLFFVVYISDSNNERTIFYSELTPLRIRKIMSVSKSSKSRSVLFKKLPTDATSIELLLRDCYHNFKAQKSFVDYPVLTLQSLTSLKKVLNISAYLPFSTPTDIPSLLFNDDASFYADFDGYSIPIDINPENIYVSKEVYSPISSNGKTYYNKYVYSKTIDEEKITINQNIVLKINSNAGKITLNYNRSNKLKEFINDCDFLISVIETSVINIGNLVLNMDLSTFKPTGKEIFDIQTAKSELSFFQKADKVLDMLCFSGDLLLSDLSEDDFKILNLLIIGILQEKPVKITEKCIPKIKKINIQQHSFYIHLSAIDVKKGIYKIYNLFDLRLKATYCYNGTEDKPTSQYSLISKDDIVNIDNIVLNDIICSFDPYLDDPENIKRLNNILLQILLAYDSEKYYDQESLLNTAIAISNKLLDVKECIELPYNTRIINHLQAIKRSRVLTDNEKDMLCSIVESETTTDIYKWAAYLLLDNKSTAKRYYDKMTDEDKGFIKQFPIFSLFLIDNS